ncbi:uncharacterized protein [Bemisia tabaci]|uniref:uncharacterized protein n=1 Tax=Bemisia tabaci TaxID=7038 RepID=UPI003B28311E
MNVAAPTKVNTDFMNVAAPTKVNTDLMNVAAPTKVNTDLMNVAAPTKVNGPTEVNAPSNEVTIIDSKVLTTHNESIESLELSPLLTHNESIESLELFPLPLLGPNELSTLEIIINEDSQQADYVTKILGTSPQVITKNSILTKLN